MPVELKRMNIKKYKNVFNAYVGGYTSLEMTGTITFGPRGDNLGVEETYGVNLKRSLNTDNRFGKYEVSLKKIQLPANGYPKKSTTSKRIMPACKQCLLKMGELPRRHFKELGNWFSIGDRVIYTPNGLEAIVRETPTDNGERPFEYVLEGDMDVWQSGPWFLAPADK